MPPLTPMPGQVVSEWAASCVVGRTRTGAGGSRPRGGKPFNHPPRIAAARAKRINGRDDEAREGGGGREGVCHLGQAYLSCGKKAGARLPSFLLSLLSKKREKRRWYKSNRSPKSHDCRRKEGATEGVGSDCIAFIIIQFPSLSPSLESYYRRRNAARGRPRSLTRAWCRASEIGRRRERDGRARYLPEQKPIDRSDDRLFYLRAATFLFSDIRITIFRAGHFPRATFRLSHEYGG